MPPKINQNIQPHLLECKSHACRMKKEVDEQNISLIYLSHEFQVAIR